MNNLPKSWCVKSTGSGNFQRSVVSYLNKKYKLQKTGKSKDWFYGEVNGKFQADNDPFGIILTMTEFIQLSKEVVNQTTSVVKKVHPSHGKWFTAIFGDKDEVDEQEIVIGQICVNPKTEENDEEIFLCQNDESSWNGNIPNNMFGFNKYILVLDINSDDQDYFSDDVCVNEFKIHGTKAQAEREVQSLKGNKFHFLNWDVVRDSVTKEWTFGCGAVIIDEKDIKGFFETQKQLIEIKKSTGYNNVVKAIKDAIDEGDIDNNDNPLDDFDKADLKALETILNKLN